MTEFVICGQLDESKKLTFWGDTRCNQGENKTTRLVVSLPNALAEGCNFYFEFLCPHNLWVSPKLTATAGESHTQVEYLLGDNILRDEGQILVQLVARNNDDQSIVFKSSLTCESAIWVSQSVNATAENAKVTDFFAEATTALGQMQDQLSTLSAVAFSGDYADVENSPTNLSEFQNDKGFLTAETVTPLIPTSLGELTNDSGYVTTEQLTPLLPTRVGQLQNDSGFITEDDLPTIPSVSNAQITIWQGDEPMGSFRLNQTANKNIYLEAVTSGEGVTVNAGNVWAQNGDSSVISFELGQTIEMAIATDLEYYYKDENGIEEGILISVDLNGKHIDLPHQKYHLLQLVAQQSDDTYALFCNGEYLCDEIPVIDPFTDLTQLRIIIFGDVQSNAAYVHYFVR